MRDTPGTVVAVEPEAEEPMEAKVVREPREMPEVSEDIQDQTRCLRAGPTMTDQARRQVARAVPITRRVWPKVV